jgi:(p)ppGpp synthase/HD superfamily hydrolase
MKMIETALKIAVEAHAGQTDKLGHAYILHPLRVMQRCRGEVAMSAAILHDVVEDTEWTFERLRDAGIEEAVIDALDALTKRDGEAYSDFVERAKRNPIAREVKLADVSDNLDLERLARVPDPDTRRRLAEKYLDAYARLIAD